MELLSEAQGDLPVLEESGDEEPGGSESGATYLPTAADGCSNSIKSISEGGVSRCGRLVCALRRTWFLKEATMMLKLALPLVRAEY